MSTGPVSEQTRRACVRLSVTGALLLMTGVIMVLVDDFVGPPGRWRGAPALAWVLIVGGLLGGALLIVVSRPGASLRPGRLPRLRASRLRRARPRTPRASAPGPSPRPAPHFTPARERVPSPLSRDRFGAEPGAHHGTASQPVIGDRAGPTEDWLRALRPSQPPET